MFFNVEFAENFVLKIKINYVIERFLRKIFSLMRLNPIGFATLLVKTRLGLFCIDMH